MDTRPTTDRIKETLFNMINYNLAGSRFLDLFSGSGAIGIEALSRGAREAVFVENNKKSVACINSNLEFTQLKTNARVMEMSADRAIDELNNKADIFDFIFMDPPYNKLLEKDVLTRLTDSNLINKDTLIIVEASLETNFDYIFDLGYEMIKEKNYKTNKHIFLKKRGD